MQGFGRITLKVVFIVTLFCSTIVLAEEECLRDSAITCFECQSWVDPRCNDPFNSTVFPLDLPHHQDCKGCCVKIITDLGSGNQRIRRTCTERLQINLFMVDHVCMSQGDGKGKMCFCEASYCNVAGHATSDVTLLSALTSFSAFLTWYKTSHRL